MLYVEVESVILNFAYVTYIYDMISKLVHV